MSAPPFKTDEEWIEMVLRMKSLMANEIRNSDPQMPFFNEFCRLCCTPYSEPYHIRWNLSCCGAPCGRPCLAIALYHDKSHCCPFCNYVFPGSLNLAQAIVPATNGTKHDLEMLFKLLEQDVHFSQSKPIFSVAELPEPLYKDKIFKDWTKVVFVGAGPVESQTKDIFTTVDVDVKHGSNDCKVSLGQNGIVNNAES